MSLARAWTEARLTATSPPFSMQMGGEPVRDTLARWSSDRQTHKIDAQRIGHTLRWRDPGSGLSLRCEAVEYADYPVVEWTLYLKNEGTRDTPIIADVRPLDITFEDARAGDPILHHNVGSPCQPNDYQPLITKLTRGSTKTISAAGGRPSNSDLPFFNLEQNAGGTIIAVGWPGQWSAEFSRDEAGALRLRAGQELTHFRLAPGEEVRTPLIVLLFYRGQPERAQNLWRRWMVECNLPRPAGKLVPTHYASCWGNMLPNAAEELEIIDGFLREGIKPDYWILDAGWYVNKGSWQSTGTWEVDAARFPKGLRELSDHLHGHDMGFVAWFEPERATAGSWLAEQHPEWVLGGKAGGLVNLGYPDAYNWVLERIDTMLTEEGIDVYRQDFNIDPLPYWRANDAPDRQGITEIRHVTGYLSFWDELRRRHPALWIDCCASGGRRNDLETLRRAVPLLRSDHFSDPDDQQCHTMGISQWMPYYGSGLGISDEYWFRSCIFPASRVGCDTRRRDPDYGLLRRMFAEFRRVEPYLLGDYYALTPYSLDRDVWVAWQFNSPELGGGMLQAFRRKDCVADSLSVRLRGLDPAATYEIEDLDTGKLEPRTGRELLDTSLTLRRTSKPASVLLVYRRR